MPGSHLIPGRPTGPVLVTGASGTIGRRLVPSLVAAGHQVRAMTRSDAAAQTAAAGGAEPVRGDVTDPASLSAAVRGCQVVIHAAGLAIGHGAGGCGYYVFDDGSTTVRDFLAGLLQAHGLTLPEAAIPGPVAAGLARALDIGWRITRRRGDPPITRMIVELNRHPFLVSDARARQELRYQPVITRVQGLQRLRDATRAAAQPANPDVPKPDAAVKGHG